jgi:hypothetical protein
MVFIAEYNKRVYYTRDKENFEAILKAKKGAVFRCLDCGDNLQFVNEHERTRNGGGVRPKSSVASHFRHTRQDTCEYERQIDTYMTPHCNSVFHKSWTFDLIKAEFLFRHWYNPHICDITTPNGTFVFVRDTHQAQDDIIQKEIYSPSKPLWILNGDKRPFTLQRYNDTIYITFQGKCDIPLFSENHRVILDTHTDKLIQIHLDILPHTTYGLVVSLVDYSVFLESTFNGCMLPNLTHNRRPFDIFIQDVSDSGLTPSMQQNDFITYYTIINTKTWIVRQANKTIKLSTTAVPTKYNLMNGMKVELLSGSRFVRLCLPTSKEAFDAFSIDVRHSYKTMLDNNNLDNECYAHFCRTIQKLINTRPLQAALNEYKRNHKLGKEYEDAERSILKRYHEVDKSIFKINTYNQVLLALKSKKYNQYNNIDKNALFNMCSFIEDVDEFITSPFSLHVKHWNQDDRFITLEHIAIANKMRKTDIITALIQRHLYLMLLSGETCVPFDEVIKCVFEMACITEGISTSDIARVLISQQGSCFEIYTIKCNKGSLRMVFLKEVFEEEYDIATVIHDSVHSHNTLQNYSYAQVEKHIAEYEWLEKKQGKKKFKLNKQQRTAIHSVIQNNFTLMTGYPGTGKSDVVKCLCFVLTELYNFTEDDIALCAPTGKAASKLKYKKKDENKDLSINPKTVHSLIGYRKDDIDCDDWEYEYDNEEDVLKAAYLKKKLVVVDEVSMLDYNICCKLLGKIDVNTTKIFLIGDRHQLPSVDYGQFLHCLAMSGVIQNHIRLTKIYRYGRQMRQLALNIKKGMPPNMKSTQKVKWHQITSHDGVLQSMLDMYHNYRDDARDKNIQNDDYFQIIIPTKSKTSLNAHKCNTFCHDRINGRTSSLFVKGERVMCNKNIPKTLMNGEFAYVVEVKDDECIVVKGKNFREPGEVDQLEKQIQHLEHKDPSKVDMTLQGIKLQLEIQRLKDEQKRVNEQLDLQNEIPDTYKPLRVQLQDLEYCYAITIHKSQGSEWENVVVILTKEHINMLNRNLLYTAITRVKQGTLHIFYDEEATIAQAVESVFIRQTCLKYILRDIFSN